MNVSSCTPTASTVTDTVELTAPNQGAIKLTGHARVAQNIERRVDRLIERESSRIERLLGVSESGDLKATFDATVTGLAGAYAADPSAPPSGVLGDIRAALRALHSGMRQALVAPVPDLTPAAPPVTTPTPDGPVPAAPETAPVDLAAAQVIAAYTAGQPLAGTFELVA